MSENTSPLRVRVRGCLEGGETSVAEVDSGLAEEGAWRFAPGATTGPLPLDCALAPTDQLPREAAVIAARKVRLRSVSVGVQGWMRRAYLAAGFGQKNPPSSAKVTLAIMNLDEVRSRFLCRQSPGRDATLISWKKNANRGLMQWHSRSLLPGAWRGLGTSRWRSFEWAIARKCRRGLHA